MELRHPVINSLVHTRSPGYVHKAPEALSQVSLLISLLSDVISAASILTVAIPTMQARRFFGPATSLLFGQEVIHHRLDVLLQAEGDTA